MSMRIGYDDADSLLTYPHVNNLSVPGQPIRMHRARSRSAANEDPGHRFLRCRDAGVHPHHTARPTTRRTPHTSRTPRTTTPHTSRTRRTHHPARTRHALDTHPARTRHAPGTHLAPTRAYKTRPDQLVRARNVFGSGVRTLAVVRTVLTTIATLTTPLRHVILLGFVV